MRGSGELRSIQGLANARSCDMMCPGVKGVSTSDNDGIVGDGGCPFLMSAGLELSSDKWVESRLSTRL